MKLSIILLDLIICVLIDLVVVESTEPIKPQPTSFVGSFFDLIFETLYFYYLYRCLSIQASKNLSINTKF